jgi:adenylate kinase
LDGILEAGAAALDHVILIDVPEPVLVERALARQRDDDREDIVRARLRVYRDKTAPLIDLYRRRGLLRKIDGDQSIEDVAKSLSEVFA